MTMMTENPPTGAGRTSDRILDPMSKISLSRSPSGDSFVVEEKKSGESSDMSMMRMNDKAKNNNRKMASLSEAPSGGQEYRHMVSSEPGSKFLPECGRYHLYASKACPNSHVALMVRTLKGLEDVIPVNYVQPHPRDHLERNWMVVPTSSGINMMNYDDSSSNNESFASMKSDQSHDFTSVRGIYEKEGDYTSNTIPLLYDTTLGTVVNNDANDICRMMNSCFDEFSSNKSKGIQIDDPSDDGNNSKNNDDSNSQMEIHEWLYPLLSLTPSPVPPFLYSFFPQQLNSALNRATHILEKQRYLTDRETITKADLKLFATLIRYDQVYSTYLSQPPRVMQSPALLDFCRDIYQLPGVAETVGMEEIRAHFLGSTGAISSENTKSGESLLDALKKPHQRHLL